MLKLIVSLSNSYIQIRLKTHKLNILSKTNLQYISDYEPYFTI